MRGLLLQSLGVETGYQTVRVSRIYRAMPNGTCIWLLQLPSLDQFGSLVYLPTPNFKVGWSLLRNHGESWGMGEEK